MSQTVYPAGRIDDRGFLLGIYRKGFTMEKGLIEVVANSLDAGAKKICSTIGEDIRISDDGRGM